MKTVTILSGKGGTGKTTVVSAVINNAKNCTIIDTDVDAANLHLYLEHQVISKEPFLGEKSYTVDPALCNSCENCYELCRFSAVVPPKEENGPFYIEPLLCEGCGVCAWFCPVNAIKTGETEAGHIFTGHSEERPFIFGELLPGNSNSGKMVTKIREKAVKAAREKGSDFIIADGPPGTACPVIASITGVHTVIFVTEPSMSGMHDLERVIELSDHFRPRKGLVINKYSMDLNITGKIEKMCERLNIPVLCKIPFEESIAKQSARGKIPQNSDIFTRQIQKINDWIERG